MNFFDSYQFSILTNCISAHAASYSLLRWCLEQDPKRRPTFEQVFTHEWFRGQVSVEQQNRTKHKELSDAFNLL